MLPLARFSRYLATRHQVLIAIADEILDRLDAADPARASDLMWLWTLGAYEVTRTIAQSPACFSPSFHRAVSDLKAELERVRVPTTKLERVRYDRRQPATPIDSDRPPDAWDPARRDLSVGDPADSFSARHLVSRYRDVLAAASDDDIRAPHH